MPTQTEDRFRRYADLILAGDPVLYWPLWDSSGNARDLSGNGHDGTFGAADITRDGNPGPVNDPGGERSRAVRFPSGAARNIYAASDADFNLPDEFAIEWWWRPYSLSAARALSRRRSGSNYFESYYTTSTNRLRTDIYIGGAIRTLDAAAGAITNNTWHHLVLRRYGSTLQWYVNGRASSSGSWAGSVNISNGAAWELGRTDMVADASFCHHAIYHRAISDWEIHARWAAGGRLGGRLSVPPLPHRLVS